ncbi:GNAT family N-acetyltransferase [Streptomyces cyaneofuscatus]|uniref:GNAT family N-acetyltransferase n=1 Tax=Streptomyces cyaneofuscatus TaxID=66883 RepID=UPI0033B5068B
MIRTAVPDDVPVLHALVRELAAYEKALLAELARICVERGYERLEWSVLNWNAPSIAFYESLGARPQDEWTVYRLTDGALARLGAAGERLGA